MATVAPPPAADQAGDLLQKLTIESQPKSVEIPEPTKKPTSNQYGSIESGNINNQISNERSVTPSVQDFTDPAICYLPNGYPSAAYYYGGFDGIVNDWDEYSRYINPDGVEINPAVYGENGSVLYHHGYGYAPYGPYSPAASPVPMGTDGQLYAPQHYQYSPYFQPFNPTSGAFAPTPVAASEGDVKISVTTEKKSLSTDPLNENLNGVANGGGIKGNSGAGPLKSNHQNPSFGSNNASYGRSGRVPASGYQDPRYGFDGLRSFPWMDGSMYSDGQSRLLANSTNTSSVSNGINNLSSRNSSYGPNSHFMGLHHPRPMSGLTATQGLINRMYPNKVYGQYGNVMRSGMAFGSHGYDSRTNSRAWPAVDNKYNKPRGRIGGCYGYGNENIDGLNELNRGPRAKSSKNQKCYSPAVLAVKGQNMMTNGPNDDEKDATIVTSDRAQYNRAEFLDTYADAKFFIIKSYSEDDVHKSIKYNVWASTPNGNKKLDAAYQEAQEKIGACPIFLFFSVNTSGQFVGLAEMVGPVDFHKNVEYWQQDKWNGCFSVKWHIVKDVPNSVLKHIILENNENKPVTNSRDTQEVKLEPGLKMLKLFKEHTSKTCILDDFGFYEGRQKTIQEKKAKQQQFQRQINSLMQIWEGRPLDEKKEGSLIDLKTQKSMEVVKELIKPSNDQGREESVVKTGDAPKGAKPVISEIRVLANALSNGC